MIRTRRAALAQSGYRFSLATNAKAFARRSCSIKKIERDDDSKKTHLARDGRQLRWIKNSSWARLTFRHARTEAAVNLFDRREYLTTSRNSEAHMADESKLRKWAAEAARQAKVEKDANEARRLASFAQYWTRLADLEEWRRDDQAA